MSDKLTKRIGIALAVIAVALLAVVGIASVSSPIQSLPTNIQPRAAEFQAARSALKSYGIIIVFLVAVLLKARQAVAYFILLYGVIEGGAVILYIIYHYPFDFFWGLHIVDGLVYIPAGIYMLKKKV